MERSEAAKYEAMWDRPEYRRIAPGESHARRFIELARPNHSHSVCDFGCGTGRGALDIALLSGAAVCAVDFASNCLDQRVRGHLGEHFRFRQHDLTAALDEQFDFGFCTDVLEHIEPEKVDAVLKNVCTASRRVYLNISTVPDAMGELIGEPLHLTVKDPFWWQERLERIGFRTDWSHYDDCEVSFYGSIYANADDFCSVSKLNVDEDVIRANIRKNLDLGLKEIVPHKIQKDTVIYLLAGGPSLNDFEQKIIEAGREGTPIVTVNGTYKWLLDRKIKPAAQVMVDGREFNRRFIDPVVDTCKYLISSQCDHELLKSLPPEQTWLWHSASSELVKGVIDEYVNEKEQGREWYPVHGGTTIITRALTLLAMLGFRRVEVFGWDSCLRGDEHHAYAQPENDGGDIFEMTVGDRKFKCHGWMVVQANDFQQVMQRIFAQIDDFEMIVHGDGIISHMINIAAGGKGNGS